MVQVIWSFLIASFIINNYMHLCNSVYKKNRSMGYFHQSVRSKVGELNNKSVNNNPPEKQYNLFDPSSISF